MNPLETRPSWATARKTSPKIMNADNTTKPQLLWRSAITSGIFLQKKTKATKREASFPSFASVEFFSTQTDLILLASGFADLDHAGQQFGHLLQRNHVRAVAQGLFGVGMGFDEQAIGRRCHRASRQDRSELALAAGLIAARPRQLDRMRGVEDNRVPELTQDGNRAHVRDEVVVAKRRAALG